MTGAWLVWLGSDWWKHWGSTSTFIPSQAARRFAFQTSPWSWAPSKAGQISNFTPPIHYIKRHVAAGAWLHTICRRTSQKHSPNDGLLTGSLCLAPPRQQGPPKLRTGGKRACATPFLCLLNIFHTLQRETDLANIRYNLRPIHRQFYSLYSD